MPHDRGAQNLEARCVSISSERVCLLPQLTINWIAPVTNSFNLFRESLPLATWNPYEEKRPTTGFNLFRESLPLATYHLISAASTNANVSISSERVCLLPLFAERSRSVVFDLFQSLPRESASCHSILGWFPGARNSVSISSERVCLLPLGSLWVERAILPVSISSEKVSLLPPTRREHRPTVSKVSISSEKVSLLPRRLCVFITN